MYNGDGFWMFADPSAADYIYAEYQGGFIGRVNRYTHEARLIQPTPNYKEKLRYNWNTPIALSPSDKSTVYIGAQFLFRSRDHGQNWERISPDLTTNDPEKQVTDLGGHRRWQPPTDTRRRQELEQCGRERSRPAKKFLGQLGAGEQL